MPEGVVEEKSRASKCQREHRSIPAKDTTFAPGTFGDVMGHAEVHEEAEDRNMWWEQGADEQAAQDKNLSGALDDMW